MRRPLHDRVVLVDVHEVDKLLRGGGEEGGREERIERGRERREDCKTGQWLRIGKGGTHLDEDRADDRLQVEIAHELADLQGPRGEGSKVERVQGWRVQG